MLRSLVLSLFFLQSTVSLAECYKPPSVIVCSVEESILKATNKFRAQNNLPPLVWKRELNWAARKWSESMAATGKISHDGFPTLRNQTIVLEFPASKVKVYGENVAWFRGYRPPDIGQFFVDRWIASAGHRANLLAKYKSMAAGYANNVNGHYATQVFGF